MVFFYTIQDLFHFYAVKTFESYKITAVQSTKCLDLLTICLKLLPKNKKIESQIIVFRAIIKEGINTNSKVIHLRMYTVIEAQSIPHWQSGL